MDVNNCDVQIRIPIIMNKICEVVKLSSVSFIHSHFT